MKSISVFFPAHNEAENIEKMVKDTVSFLKKTKLDYEVLVIIDHCTDDTQAIIEKKFKDNKQVKAIVNDGVGGYGSALKKGFSSFTKDMVFFTDSDLQFDIRELKLLLNKINKYDYVIGYRINRKDPVHRSLNANLWKIGVRIVLGVKVRDIDCAFKLFKKETIQSIDIKSDSALINAEILFKLKKQHKTFTQIGVHHFARQAGEPTGAKIKVILKAFRDLMRLRFNQL